MTRTVDMHSRSVAATKKMFEAQGYEIIDVQPSEYIDLVIKDDDALAFIAVKARRGELSSVIPSRDKMEQEVGAWLSDHPETTNMTVRLDMIGVNIVSNDRALIRHHINVFSNNSLFSELLEELLEYGEITQKAYDQLKAAIS